MVLLTATCLRLVFDRVHSNGENLSAFFCTSFWNFLFFDVRGGDFQTRACQVYQHSFESAMST
eukprot:m.123768 g.123768  ORF g.123768 m.123768 type:complete len:63 (-) comp23397_c0_seq1:512-700(-)